MTHLILQCEECPDAPIEQSFFEIIYHAAKEKNLAKIQAVLPYVSVDVNDCAYGPPVRKLALEGNIEAVNFLRTHFNASSHWTACGYAQDGYFDELFEVTKSVEHTFKRFSLMLSLASSYAEGGWVEEEDTIMGICPLNPSERKLFLKYFAKGYAIGGYVDEVNRILTLNPTFKEDPEFMVALVYGYAYAGNVVETNKILNISNPTHYFNLIKNAIRGYARKGLVVEVSKLYGLIANPADQFELYHEMIYNFSFTGQVARVNKILSLFTNNNDLLTLWKSAIYGYAKGGYFYEANKILCFAVSDNERKALQKDMALGFAYGEHFDKVNDVLGMALDTQERIDLLNQISIGYGWVSQMGKILELHRSALAKEQFVILKSMMYGYGCFGQVDDAKTVLTLTGDATQRLSMLKQLLNGLTKEGFIDLANEMLALQENYNEKLALMSWMGDGYASAGYYKEAAQLLDLTANPEDRLSVLTDIVKGSLNNHYQDTNKFLGLAIDPTQRNKLIKVLVTILKKRNIFLRPESILSIMVKFNPEYQNEIYAEAKENFDSKKLLLTSIKLNKLMDEHKINYRQASAWIEPHLQFLVLQGVSLIQNRKLTTETFLLIFSYLSPMLIPEVYVFSDKLSSRIGKQGFFTKSTRFNNSAKYSEQNQYTQALKNE